MVWVLPGLMVALELEMESEEGGYCVMTGTILGGSVGW